MKKGLKIALFIILQVLLAALLIYSIYVFITREVIEQQHLVLISYGSREYYEVDLLREATNTYSFFKLLHWWTPFVLLSGIAISVGGTFALWGSKLSEF